MRLQYSNLEFLIEAVQPNPWIERILLAAFVLGGCLLVASIAHPHYLRNVPASNLRIALCIDTSGSMASTDIPPSRADAVRTAIVQSLADFPPDTRMTVISFATHASVLLPPSNDRRSVADAFRILPKPNGATAIGDALAVAAVYLSARAYVVLLTDGVSNRGRDPLDAARALAEKNVRIYTVGIGTQHGDVLAGTSERATIDEEALRRYARIGHGTYFHVASARDLKDIITRIAQTIGYRRVSADLAYPYALCGGVLVLLSTLAAIACGRLT